MIYAVINLTNYGTGFYQVGVFRSEKRANDIKKRLAKFGGENDGYTVIALRSLDKYTDDSIVESYKLDK